MGLLSRASNLDEKPGLAFSDFIIKYNLKTCAILKKDEVYYSIFNSIGFDSDTVHSISSTQDFWKGICKLEGMVYHFKKENDSLTPLLQLFSLKMKEQLTDIYACRTADSKIFLSVEEIVPEAVKDLEIISSGYHKCEIENLNKFIKDGSSVLKFKIDFSKAVSDFGKDSEIIFNEYYNRMVCLYNKPDASAFTEHFGLKTVFIEDRTYSEKLIEKHLKLVLADVTEDSSKIKIDFLGTVNSRSEVKDFLQA